MTKSIIKISAVMAILAAAFSSCNPGKVVMNKTIDVYEVEPLDPDAEVAPISIVELNVFGGETRLVVKTELEYKVEFKKSLKDTVDWLAFEELGYDKELGGDVISITYKPMTTTFTRRSGVLSFSAPSSLAGTFLTVRQGFSSRYSNNWAWLKYGDEDPTIDGSGRIMSSWNATQKDYGYTSTTIEGQEEPYVYGRNHLIQLGSENGYGADLITPYIESIANDSLAVLCFKAFAYTDLKGVSDNGKVTVEILGDGVAFNDYEGKSVTFEAGKYDYLNAVESIEQANTYYFFVKTTNGNSISSSTRFRIIAGEMGKMDKPNRIIIDNLYVYQVHASYYPYFKTEEEATVE